MIQSIHQGLLAEGIKVPLTKLCAWFGVPRRTVYYRPTKAAPKVDPRFAEPIITPHCPQQTDVIEQPRSAAFANFMFEHLVTPEAELASAFVASVA